MSVARTARDPVRRRALVARIAAADVAWVLATPAAMIAGPGRIPLAAHGLLLVVAAVVALPAAQQWRGLRRVR